MTVIIVITLISLKTQLCEFCELTNLGKLKSTRVGTRGGQVKLSRNASATRLSALEGAGDKLIPGSVRVTPSFALRPILAKTNNVVKHMF